MKAVFIISVFFISISLPAQVSFNQMPNQPPANIYSVVTDPTNGDIYASTVLTIMRSTDQGATWTQIVSPHLNIIKLLYFSANGQLYAGANYSNTTPLYGITKYDKVTNTWTVMTGSPQNVSSIIEDASGNVYAGTGSTSNIQPNPVNFGTGVYFFNGTTWSAINTGMANLSGYSVLPFIKDLKILSGGNIIAATYGNGVLKYSGGTWSQNGTGLSNAYVNCLFINSSGTVYAGTDAGVNVLSGTIWSNAGSGITVNKPVRTLVATASGTMYAGLGFYIYQKGSISGEIFYSTNNGASWQNAAAGFNSTTVTSMAVHSSGTVFASANGVWKAASPNNWQYAMSSLNIANNTLHMANNQQGDLFIICRNLSNTITGCAGVFRSTDNGLTWVSINNGINCQKTDGIIVDSQGWLWLTTKEFVGASNNPAFGNPELYYSSDNGNTWIKETTIETTSDGFNQIADDGLGRVFVAESFTGLSTNISSSTNHAAFQNNLQPPPNNGGKSFGLAINSQHHIFHGTETTPALYRSTSNGAPGSFVSLATPGVGYAPGGNVSVYIDPYTDYVFSSCTHGLLNGNIIPKNILGSTNIDNGSNMFAFNNLPDYVFLSAMAFDNRGNCYTSINGNNPSIIGLYTASFPWDSTTVFTRVVNGGFSYYFADFMIDDCGYLYGMNLSGGGINKSVLPVNTPLQSTLTSPANNAIGVSLTPSLTWTHKCIPDSFRLQIALDAAFNYVVDDHAGLIATNYTVGTAVLSSGIKYYWRVYGVNAAGVGKWSTVNNFKTLTALPLTLLSFGGVYRTENNTVQLSWVTANEINTHHFMVERSEDAANFTAIGTLMACNNCGNVNNYRFTDSVVTVNKVYYYRLKIFQANGSSTFSNIIAVKKNQGGQIKLLPNPVTSLSELQIISENNMDAIFQLFDVKGGKIVEEKLVLQKGSNRDIIKTGKLKLSAGVYQAVVITPGGSETFKLVIQ